MSSEPDAAAAKREAMMTLRTARDMRADLTDEQLAAQLGMSVDELTAWQQQDIVPYEQMVRYTWALGFHLHLDFSPRSR